MNIIKENIIPFLKQPYPFYYQGKELIVITTLIFFMSFSFNYFFEPFDVYVPEHKMDFFWISLIHAISPVILIILLSLIGLNSQTEENWTIGKDIVFLFLYLLLIGIAQFLIRDLIYDNPNNWSLKYLIEEIRNTIFVGVLFALIIIPLNFSRLNSKNTKQANYLNTSHDSTKSTESKNILIKTKLKNEDLQLNVKNLLFAKAEGNYVELYLKEEKVNKVLKRITIKELESILKPYPAIIKTHRSYLVNLEHIKNVSGNAQGYKLKLDKIPDKIPVSRNMITKFNLRMNSN